GAAVMVLPIYKGLWIGFLPILVALAGWGFFRRDRIAAGVMRLLNRPVVESSEPAFYILVLVVPALIQCVLAVTFRSELVTDAKYVAEQARVLAETGAFSPLTRYAPASVWWYAAFIKVFGYSSLVIQLSLIPLSIGRIYLTYHVARFFCENAQARWVAFLTAFFPSLLVMVLSGFYYLYLYAFFFTLMLFLLLVSLRAGGKKAATFSAGLAGGAAALTLPVMLTAPAFAGLIMFFHFRTLLSRRLWIAWLTFLLGFTIVLTPWVARNYRVFGEFVPVCTAGGYVFYSANNPESNGLYSPAAEAAGVEVTEPSEYLAVSREYSARAKQWIHEDPAAFFRLALKKNMFTWGTDTTFLDLVNVRGRQSEKLDLFLNALLQCAYVLLVLFWVARGISDSVRGRKPDFLQSFIAVLVCSLWLVYSIFEGGARHHLILLPFIILYCFSGKSSASSCAEESTT
ncbi:MAG: hypothetical protein KJ626_15995, partial [Verrucomicrobia bacterium]|nr:hypothetical protein [Verrucomicrobiota bacterium]